RLPHSPPGVLHRPRRSPVGIGAGTRHAVSSLSATGRCSATGVHLQSDRMIGAGFEAPAGLTAISDTPSPLCHRRYLNSDVPALFRFQPSEPVADPTLTYLFTVHRRRRRYVTSSR